MNRKSLLTLLKANGYTEANPTLETVKAHVAKLASEGVELHDKDGTPINVDAVWAAKSVLTLAADDADTALSESQRKSIIAQAKGSTSPHGDAEVSDRRPNIFSIGNNAKRKAYQAKIKAGVAVFDDVDHAEAAGAWIRQAIAGVNGYAEKANDMDICRKAGVTFNQQLGGALVPQEFAPQLIWLTEQYGVSLKLANVVPMSSDSKAYPRKTGIAAMSPIAENGTISATDNNYNNVTLTAKKYGVLYKVTNELLNDAAISVADDLMRSVAEAKAYAIDDAYFNGDGTAAYANQMGLKTALTSYTAQASGSTWAAQTTADLLGLIGQVEYVNPARLAFVCSRQYYAQVMQRLATATSQFTPLTSGSIKGDATFLGFPVLFAQVMPTATATTQKCLYFGDFMGGTMIGDRNELTIASSEQFYFDSDSIAFRGTARFNVAIHGAGRGETYGPVVGLKTS